MIYEVFKLYNTYLSKLANYLLKQNAAFHETFVTTIETMTGMSVASPTWRSQFRVPLIFFNVLAFVIERTNEGFCIEQYFVPCSVPSCCAAGLVPARREAGAQLQ